MKKSVLNLQVIVRSSEIYPFVKTCRQLGLGYAFSHGNAGIDEYLWYNVSFNNLYDIYWLGRFYESSITK